MESNLCNTTARVSPSSVRPAIPPRSRPSLWKRLLALQHLLREVGLDFGTRMQIGLDAVEGIRFLHGQGLLHRDIKLKNVL
ncbi:Dual serine/threonine and tyrosine protein kinase, partial [Geodia barretti]